MSDNNLIIASSKNGVMTLTMNMPRRYNGWTLEMLTELREGLQRAARDETIGACVLTGADPYYCAGVNLAGTLKLDHPKKLHAMIVKQNQALFDMFIDFPKPIIIAANGPAIGASVTSASLCDAIIASTEATFSTPFARLGVSPEGCSSYLFPRLLGEDSAARMLFEEGWIPTAHEAHEIGLVDEVVEHDVLLSRAQEVAEAWISEGKIRSYKAGATREKLKAVNAEESVALASSFLSPAFLDAQFKFLWSRNKTGPALMFLSLRLTYPIWSQLL